MRVFLLRNNAESGVYKLSQKEKNYLFRVLRLNVNDIFTAKDSHDIYYKAFLFDEDSITLEETDKPEDTLLDGLSSYNGPFTPITAFISVLKGKKNEMEVRALTEMGIKKIVLMETEFVQSPISKHQMERFSLIIREAVQQSGSKEPELVGPLSFKEALTEVEGKLLILHQSAIGGTMKLSEAVKDLSQNSPLSFMIGPEGGFSDKECEEAVNNGATPVLLCTNILRAETAAIYTASSLQTLMQG